MSGNGRFRIMHISDLHLTCTGHTPWKMLLNKRLLGYVRWKLKRSKEYDSRILDLLYSELQKTRPHHIIITGDLTHLGLPAEFKRISQWLKTLGIKENITIIPGNHDTYVSSSWDVSFSYWQDYLLPYSDYRGVVPPPSLEDVFPTLQIRKDIAILGLSTARPCSWHLATGTVGKKQLQRLETMLKKTGDAGYFRILGIHHPPAPGLVKKRKELTDASHLLEILERQGCELILHGHSHRTSVYSVNGPSGPIPSIEAPSALSVSPLESRRARYFIYEIRPVEDRTWNCKMTERFLLSVQDGFINRKEYSYLLKSPG